MDALLQDISTILDHTLDLEIILEIQPTQFHHHHIQGWSLTVMMVASGQEHHAVRGTWGYGIHVHASRGLAHLLLKTHSILIASLSFYAPDLCANGQLSR